MYRLVASPFLKLGMAAAIVGYRTWPDGNAKEQVDDLEQAALFLARQFPGLCTHAPLGRHPSHYGTCLMGHSSGAHIALLMLVDRARRKLQTGAIDPLEFDSYVGLSGPYNISHHFDYEAARGVEELSPMKPACGYSRNAFRLHSPAMLWMQYLTGISECGALIESAFPRILLIHGIEDSTVPFTATAEAARILRSCGVCKCDEIYVARIGHQEIVMEVMMGGKTRDSIIEWLQNPSGKVLRFATNSKL
jgi:acetyl esterase/lipase